MRIILTGSSGFIGFHLAKVLLEMDYHVTGIDNHNDYYKKSLKIDRNKILEGKKNFTFHNLDLNDSLECINEKFDIAINLAAQAGVRIPYADHSKYHHSNILGFKNFCNFCIKKSVKKIIYASSSSVYDDSFIGKFSETRTKLKPKSTYGLSKLKNEQLSEELHKKHSLQMIGLRFFSVYGPFGRPDMAYYHFTKSLIDGKKIKLFNKGEMLRDMTYIDDIVSGIIGAINFLNTKKNSFHEIFNLGSDDPISSKQLLSFLETELNKTAVVYNQNSFDESLFTHASLSKSKRILGYNPKIKFEEGMRKFLKWYANYEKK